MLTYSKLGSFGNLGNQLFEIASLAGFAKQYNHEWKIPIWQYSNYFKNKPLTISHTRQFLGVPEKAYHFTPEYWNEKISMPGNYDISGWLQSEKNWDCDKEFIKTLFEFEETNKKRLIEKYKNVFEKPTIAISIRRGDFVGNPNYDLLPIEYYIGALWKNFPNYQDYNIFCFSDDINYCRHHFQCLDNVFFPRNEQGIQQLILMSNCNHFIISQSTFSWWGAYLGEKEESIVIRPNYNTAGKLLESLSEKDFWPERWNNIYDHKKEKIDLSDVTFTIPVMYDHEDRSQNLKLSLQYLNSFDTKIIIGEQGGLHFQNTEYQYVNFPYNTFHRTKMLNEMALISNTKYIVNWDADIIINPMQILHSVNLLNNGYDMVYPYNGKFARVDRKKWYIKLRDSNDTGTVSKEIFNGTRPHDALSVGGAIFFNRESFFKGGMENEKFISYAPEDQERFYRFNKLGYKVTRVNGPLYHIDHFIGENSWTKHQFYKDNEKEYQRIRNISDLQKEIETWSWYHPYTSQYYSEIIGGSTKSRDEIFKLEEFEDINSIIDIGAGIGQWGKDLTIEYLAVDYKIPKELLLVDNYLEWDIIGETPLEVNRKYDLALCLEVLEHIPEEFAEKTIKKLTELSDKILFSAAIPGQGGINHINEQWQTYWAKIFKKFGYFPISLDIRDNPNIEIWYKNNMYLYVNRYTYEKVTDYIHPELYTNIIGTLTNWQKIKKY